MAWKESDRVSERLDFVKLASVEGANISEICRRFGVSRKTGYKWLLRWKKEGPDGLVDRSRRPSRSPSRTSEKVEEQVCLFADQNRQSKNARRKRRKTKRVCGFH